MKELFTGCSIPEKPTDKQMCTSSWGELLGVQECSTCDLPQEIRERCKCFANYELKTMQNCDANIKTNRLEGDQFCGFIDDDGMLMPCGPGCCKQNGCPGQCCDGLRKEPEGKRPSRNEVSPSSVFIQDETGEYYVKIADKKVNVLDIFLFATFVTIVSIVFSTLSTI